MSFAGRYHEILFINGRIAPAIDVTVKDAGTSNDATIYTDRSKASTASSIVRTDSDGNLTFFAEPGYYDLHVQGVIVSNILVPVDYDIATQSELDAHIATPHGGTHPDLATHDSLGLATQAELDAHTTTHPHPDLTAHDTLGLATQSELDAHAATPHGGTHPDLATHDSLGLATQTELDTVIQTIGVRSRITTFPFTFAATDAGTFKDFDIGTASQVNIPTAATFGAGTSMTVGTAFVTLSQMGLGQIEIVPLAGVTLESRGGARKLAGQHAVATLHRRSTDVWVLSGDIVV